MKYQIIVKIDLLFYFYDSLWKSIFVFVFFSVDNEMKTIFSVRKTKYLFCS